MKQSIIRYLEHFPAITADQAILIYTIFASTLSLLIIVLVSGIIRRAMLRVLKRFADSSTTILDDLMVRHKVFKGLSNLLAPVLVHLFAAPVLEYYPGLIPLVRNGATLYLTVVIILVTLSAIDAFFEYFQEHRNLARLPLKSFIQVIKTVIVFLGAITVLSKLIGESPIVFISGLGAFTALLLLIFKDSILGLVAGIQLSTNDLVRLGDWIELPKYGADGDVIDISLVTVSVRNADRSISTIPAYALISEGFKNWRGMSESEGRRIKRSLNIDMTSVAFCDEAMFERLFHIELLQRYLLEKKEELNAYNKENFLNPEVPVNGRRLTNLGTFRAYLLAYLRRLPVVNAEMTLMVRYLQSTEHGLPLEIYLFSKEKDIVAYEAVQADVMDHLLAVLPFFGLRVYQSPTGYVPVQAVSESAGS
ncbi:mechanosensitive ion channel family protein [Chlorobium phaeobacteroides]|uniref:MscS Mechanosensitive ion channel n=1 Tax=Chlorobium phaeobacteroides (strain DSM 266 / SMG 266 / 2430) TaxID=290317 RepID=A1BEV3_CHLPD|nr:mechanosensitive ion channel domain-containing protein [Chlorobium phaeobacteroides]ABL64930.1 MscS Mechanosensitive ion channel [Chlorobium phaeobacteroides DSM 266]